MSESAIINVIKGRRAGDAFLAEESGEASGTSGIRWVIDPLDGTTNFAHGRSYYAVSVAAEASGRVIAAVVCQPDHGLWLGWGPTGTTGNSKNLGLSSCDRLSGALVSFAVPYDAQRRRTAYCVLADVAPSVQDLRNFGSTACDLFAVATGDLDGFIGFGQQPWDTAAGLALVDAAGGTSRRGQGSDGMEIVIAGSHRLVDALAGFLLDHL